MPDDGSRSPPGRRPRERDPERGERTDGLNESPDDDDVGCCECHCCRCGDWTCEGCWRGWARCWSEWDSCFNAWTCHLCWPLHKSFWSSKTHPPIHAAVLSVKLLLAFLIMLVLFLPWTFVWFTRPKWRHGIDHHGNSSSRYRRYDPGAHHDFRSLWPAARRHVRRDSRAARRERARRDIPYVDRRLEYDPTPRLIDLAWDEYGIARELIQTVRRQSLQLLGAGAAIVVAFMQVEMIYHDLNMQSILSYIQSIKNQDNDAVSGLANDTTCAYADGTGIANWGSGYENIVWFLTYHLVLILLCVAMFVDEAANVRVGLFAPQWNRAGNGWTLIFLVCATVSTSADYGIKALYHLRFFVLMVLFGIGCFNVLKGAMGGAAQPGSKAEREGYRVNRFPFRLWRGEEHPDAGVAASGLTAAEARRRLRTARTGGRMLRKLELQRLNFRELPPDQEVMVAEWRWDPKAGPAGDWKETETAERVRYRRHLFERWQYAIGDASWPQAWEDEEFYTQLMRSARTQAADTGAGTKALTQVELGLPDKYHMEDNKLGLKWYLRGCPTPKMPRLRKKDRDALAPTRKKQYPGLADWHPKARPTFFRWLDLRRVLAMIVAVAMFVLQMLLAYDTLSIDRLGSYREQYMDANTAWTSNHGPSNSDCAYYKESTLAIYVQPGSGSYKCVLASMAFIGMWHAALMGMCISIFLTAWSNNRYYGMHVQIPFITLVGVRMSSISIGNTLGFVAISTLQLGFFFDNPAGVWIARLICYAAFAVWILFWYPNEPLRHYLIRDPFFEKHVALSAQALMWMDNKAHFHETYEDHVAEPDKYIFRPQRRDPNARNFITE
ncbi:hypothetical protein Q5752_001089 [Cryptotrichosporon argae]